MSIPEPLQDLMGRMWRDIQQAGMQREYEAAKADPQKYRLSRTFPPGVKLNYRYYDGGKNGRGSRVHFCYTTNRNVAGYFIAWRETITAKHVKRDMWTASRSKKTIIARCKDRYDKFKARRSNT